MRSRENPSADFFCVRKLKFDEMLRSEWEGDLLPSPDADWVLIIHHPDRHLKFTNSGVETSGALFLHCCNVVEPLTILFQYSPEGQFQEAKCDAALPAVWKDDSLEFVDLDMDLIVAPDFSFQMRDEVQFAQNRIRLGYPDKVVGQAHRGMALSRQLVRSRVFPFDQSLLPVLQLPTAL